jgi:hypothetical protein
MSPHFRYFPESATGSVALSQFADDLAQPTGRTGPQVKALRWGCRPGARPPSSGSWLDRMQQGRPWVCQLAGVPLTARADGCGLMLRRSAEIGPIRLPRPVLSGPSTQGKPAKLWWLCNKTPQYDTPKVAIGASFWCNSCSFRNGGWRPGPARRPIHQPWRTSQ